MPRGKREFPRHFGTSRFWKASMRRSLRKASRALSEAAFGCYFNPDSGRTISEAERQIKIALDLCSAKKWGR